MRHPESFPFKLTILFLSFYTLGLLACNDSEKADPASNTSVAKKSETETIDTSALGEKADAATILARKQVPVLCYHQIREWRARDSKVAKDYIVPVAAFREQIKMLKDSGYHTILPDQMVAYLERGASLPAKPIMLTFDDTDLSQYTVVLPELEKAGFKGVFFLMTVTLNRPGYMTREHVKELASKGHVIGSHTWDHQNVKKLKGEDWVKQIDNPTKQIQEITGAPVKYFAYPFGLWSHEIIPEIKSRGFTAAFQLSIARDKDEPLYTIRRIIVPGYWTTAGLSKAIGNSFRGY